MTVGLGYLGCGSIGGGTLDPGLQKSNTKIITVSVPKYTIQLI